jgi:hypothetical protein
MMPRTTQRRQLRLWTEEERWILQRHCTGWTGRRTHLCQLLARVIPRTPQAIYDMATIMRLWPARQPKEVNDATGRA